MPNTISPGLDKTDTQSVVLDPSGAIGARFDYRGRRRVGTTQAPTVAAGAGAGTGATASIAAGTDDSFTVTINIGTAPAAGTLATVTFATPYNSAPFCSIDPRDARGGAALLFANSTATQLVIGSANAPTASGPMNVDVVLVGGA